MYSHWHVRYVEPSEFFRCVGYVKPHIQRVNGVWVVLDYVGDAWSRPRMEAQEFVRQYLVRGRVV